MDFGGASWGPRGSQEDLAGVLRPVRVPEGACGGPIGPRRALEELLWALEGLLGVLEGLRGVLWGS